MNPDRRRAPIKRRIRELAIYAMATVDLTDLDLDAESAGLKAIAVSYIWKGENVTTPTCFLGPSPGRTDPAAIGKGPLTIDRFTIPGHIVIPGFKVNEQGATDAEEAAERALNALARTIASCDAGLVHDDVTSDMDPRDFRTTDCFVSDVDLYSGFEDARAMASLSGGVTFSIDCKYPIKPTALPTGS